MHEPWWVNSGQVGLATIDERGRSDYGGFEPSKLKKISAPQYVVVWTDKEQDPFAQFETRKLANAFAAKMRKRSDILEVRVYKLTK